MSGFERIGKGVDPKGEAPKVCYERLSSPPVNRGETFLMNKERKIRAISKPSWER